VFTDAVRAMDKPGLDKLKVSHTLNQTDISRAISTAYSKAQSSTEDGKAFLEIKTGAMAYVDKLNRCRNDLLNDFYLFLTYLTKDLNAQDVADMNKLNEPDTVNTYGYAYATSKVNTALYTEPVKNAPKDWERLFPYYSPAQDGKVELYVKNVQ